MKSSWHLPPPADPAQRLVVHLYRDFYPKRGGIEDHLLTLAQTPSPRYRHLVLTAAKPPLYRLTHYYNLASTAGKLAALLQEFHFAPRNELRHH